MPETAKNKGGRPRSDIKAESKRIANELLKLEREHGIDSISRLRRSINAQMIVTRLQEHIRGEIELAATQIQAAALLLSRCLPALQQVEVSAVDIERVTVIRAPERTQSAEDWQKLIDHKPNGHTTNGHDEPGL
jgi:hypothetical protein